MNINLKLASMNISYWHDYILKSFVDTVSYYNISFRAIGIVNDVNDHVFKPLRVFISCRLEY